MSRRQYDEDGQDVEAAMNNYAEVENVETMHPDADEEEILEGELCEPDEEPEPDREDVGEIKDRLLRLSADFDNFRKRTQKEQQDWRQYASQSMMEKLLPVMDNMDAAEAAVLNASPEAKNVAEGFQMIHKQLMDILLQEGLSEILALGMPFDPNIHEAVMMVSPAEGQRENEVVAVLRRGYMFKDKVLRPVMVQVAKNE